MRAIILAGGKGTRLKPYTVVLPKPLMPIGEYPILEVVVRQLVKSGFKHITMAVNIQANIIKAFFGSGKKWGVTIDYSFEDIPLGTIGPLKLIKNLPDDFLVMNGDILTDLDFKAFYQHHVVHKNIFTISSHYREQKTEYGVLETDEKHRLVGFQEKPIIKYEVSMGIYMVNKKILQFIPSGQLYGFDNLMHDLIKTGNIVSVKPFKGYWLDMGRPDDYMQAIEEFDKLKERFLS